MTFHFDSLGATFREALNPKEVGEQLVSHVLPAAKEPAPDFEAMNRLLKNTQEKWTVPKDADAA